LVREAFAGHPTAAELKAKRQVAADAYEAMRREKDPRLKAQRQREDAEREMAIRNRVRLATTEEERVAAETELAALEAARKIATFCPHWAGAVPVSE
jgi:hypothetical protein